MKPRIGITMGDPAGVGPELVLRLLSHSHVLEDCVPVVFGDRDVLKQVAEAAGLSLPDDLRLAQASGPGIEQPTLIDLPSFAENGVEAGQVNRHTGGASFDYIQHAIEAALAGQVDAVTTGPIHKEAWQAAGIRYPGHTEVFAEAAGTEDFCMMMTSAAFSCSLVTTHVGYRDVPGLLTQDLILRVTRLTAEALQRIYDRTPSLVMLGLNPHAGENGLFGNREEELIIGPAAEAARQLGINISDPLPPDTAFLPWRREQTDGYICMYHDQGLIPFKAFNFDQGVNVTLGLPNLIRTSVDHGTALDIAWQGRADESSLISAVQLATRLAVRKS